MWCTSSLNSVAYIRNTEIYIEFPKRDKKKINCFQNPTVNEIERNTDSSYVIDIEKYLYEVAGNQINIILTYEVAGLDYVFVPEKVVVFSGFIPKIPTQA